MVCFRYITVNTLYEGHKIIITIIIAMVQDFYRFKIPHYKQYLRIRWKFFEKLCTVCKPLL